MIFFSIITPPLYLFCIPFEKQISDYSGSRQNVAKKSEHFSLPFCFYGLLFVSEDNILQSSGQFVSTLIMRVKNF